MAPSISVREYIRWLPEPASEPTKTIVLTSSAARFVDIRILNSTKDSDANEELEDHLPQDKLDWAFAGFSSSEYRPDPNSAHDNKIVHSRWNHWVDSRTTDVESVEDEGDMFPKDENLTVEKGSMVNPSTGTKTEYEEMWRDVEPLSTTDGIGTTKISVNDMNGSKGTKERVCMVLQLQDDINGARGMIVRVGQYCQGVLRVGEHFSLEQWEWKGCGRWERVEKIGDFWVPCGVVLENQKLKLNGEVTHGEFVWRVVEMEEF